MTLKMEDGMLSNSYCYAVAIFFTVVDPVLYMHKQILKDDKASVALWVMLNPQSSPSEDSWLWQLLSACIARTQNQFT